MVWKIKKPCGDFCVRLTIVELGGKSYVDTEDAEVSETVINGYNVLVVYEDGMYMLIWSDGIYEITLFSNEAYDILLQIAESLHYIN